MATEKPSPITKDDIPSPYDMFLAMAKANRHPKPEEWAEAASRAYDDGVAYPDEEQEG